MHSVDELQLKVSNLILNLIFLDDPREQIGLSEVVHPVLDREK